MRSLLSILPFAVCATVASAQPPMAVSRAIADPSFGVKMTIAKLQSEVRQGEIRPDFSRDATLAMSTRTLHQTSKRAGHLAPPRADLGDLWDFTLDSITVTLVNRDSATAVAHAYFATAPTSGGTVTLGFHRIGMDWVLTTATPLSLHLQTLSRALAGGTLR